MEKLNNGKKNLSKVYYLNESNKKMLEGMKNVKYSKTKNYAMVFAEEDKKYIDEMYWYVELHNNLNYGTDMDRIYNYILGGSGIIDKSLEYKNIEPNYDEYEFIHDFEECPPVYINKEDSKNEGSDVLFIHRVLQPMKKDGTLEKLNGEFNKESSKHSFLYIVLEDK